MASPSQSSRSPRVTFVLPCPSRATPVGGFRSVYQHANGLAARGYRVTVVHPAAVDRERAPGFRDRARYWTVRLLRRDRPLWFDLASSVRCLWRPTPEPDGIPDAGIVVATAWQTAEWVMGYPASKGAKLYLVQDFEYYMSAEPPERRRILRTLTSGMPTIAISPAVEGMLRDAGVRPVATVPIGIEGVGLPLEAPIDGPGRNLVGFPTRDEPFKATDDAIAALTSLRAEGLLASGAWSFGGEPHPSMPDWVDYHHRPSDATLRRLYNRSAVFLVPSHYEGWGLPGAEAMSCGSALVSTDNGGVRAYAANGETALLVPPGRPDLLAKRTRDLLEDPRRRVELATAGYRHVRRFTWERAADAFAQVVREALEAG